jgi:hypothetical protein
VYRIPDRRSAEAVWDVGDRGRDDGSRFDDVGTSKIGEWSLWLIAMLMICFLICSFSTLFSLFLCFYLFLSTLWKSAYYLVGCDAWLRGRSQQQTNLLTPMYEGS